MSIASKIRGVSGKACISITKVFHAAGRKGLFWVGAGSYCGLGNRIRFATLRVFACGEGMLSVLVEKGLYSRK